MSEISAAEFVNNIAKAENWLKGRPGYRPWFRFPYLDQAYARAPKSRKVSTYLREAGLADAWVTVDGSDWAIEGQTQLARAAAQAGRHGGAPVPLCQDNGGSG